MSVGLPDIPDGNKVIKSKLFTANVLQHKDEIEEVILITKCKVHLIRDIFFSYNALSSM